jgi:putative redox protein
MDNHIVQIFVEYLGDLHCEITHGPSGQKFLTDAPLDNHGKAEYISPTDLLGTASASCIATIMGIVANNNNIDIKGLKITVSKEMANEPFRRISKLTLDILFPHSLNDKEFKLMKNVVNTCPVTRSLSNELEFVPNFSFAE